MKFLFKIALAISLLSPSFVSAINVPACVEASRAYWLLLEANAIRAAEKQEIYSDSICPKFENTKNNKELSEMIYLMKNDTELVALVQKLIARGTLKTEPFSVELAPYP